MFLDNEGNTQTQNIMWMVFGAERPWIDTVKIDEETAVFHDTQRYETVSGPHFWKAPIQEAFTTFLSHVRDRKEACVFLDYHGNLVSPFLNNTYMLEAFKKAFPTAQGDVLKEKDITNNKDHRKTLFDVARSHIEDIEGHSNIIRPVLSYIVDLLKTFQLVGLDMALLSSTSIEAISQNFNIFKNIEGQIIQAGIAEAFMGFRAPRLNQIKTIKGNSLGFFMEKQDKAQGFELIMGDLQYTSAIIMEDSQENIDSIIGVCRLNGWNLLVIKNTEALRQKALILKDEWLKETYMSYLRSCLYIIPIRKYPMTLLIFDSETLSRPPTAATSAESINMEDTSTIVEIIDDNSLFKHVRFDSKVTQITSDLKPLTPSSFTRFPNKCLKLESKHRPLKPIDLVELTDMETALLTSPQMPTSSQAPETRLTRLNASHNLKSLAPSFFDGQRHFTPHSLSSTQLESAYSLLMRESDYPIKPLEFPRSNAYLNLQSLAPSFFDKLQHQPLRLKSGRRHSKPIDPMELTDIKTARTLPDKEKKQQEQAEVSVTPHSRTQSDLNISRQPTAPLTSPQALQPNTPSQVARQRVLPPQGFCMKFLRFLGRITETGPA